MKYLEDIFVTRFNGYDYYLGPHSEEPIVKYGVESWKAEYGLDYVVPNYTLIKRALHSLFLNVRQEFLDVKYWVDDEEGGYRCIQELDGTWVPFSSPICSDKAYVRLFKRKKVDG